jgi:hypothetical protein
LLAVPGVGPQVNLSLSYNSGLLGGCALHADRCRRQVHHVRIRCTE